MIKRRIFLKSASALGLFQLRLVDEITAEEGRRCEQNLWAIHDAVMAYRESRGRLPNNLTTLVLEKFIDARLLICPSHGENEANRLSQLELIDGVGDDPLTLYVWEFPGGGSDFHERQTRIGAGDWVPIVRCREHTVPDTGYNHLNLSLGGAIYPSGTYWEHELVHLVPYIYLRAKAILNAKPLIPLKERIPARSPLAATRQIDLGPAFNVALTDPWAEGHLGEEAPSLFGMGGVQRMWTTGKDAFEIRGAVQIEGQIDAAGGAGGDRGSSKLKRFFPARMRPVAVDVSAETLHVLCGLIRYRSDRNQDAGWHREVGRLIVIDQSGHHFDLRLKDGVNVSGGVTLENPENASIVWSREVETKGFLGTRSVSHIVWPLGGTRYLQEIRFESSQPGFFPFLLAITAD